MRHLIKRLITPPLMLVAALLMFAEEVLWEALKRLMAQVGRLPLIRTLEAWIARLPPYGAACVFLLPGTLLLPVKIGALWLIAHGHALLGVQLIVVAKLVGTALVARIFMLTKPALMTLRWFARLHGFIMFLARKALRVRSREQRLASGRVVPHPLARMVCAPQTRANRVAPARPAAAQASQRPLTWYRDKVLATIRRPWTARRPWSARAVPAFFCAAGYTR